MRCWAEVVVVVVVVVEVEVEVAIRVRLNADESLLSDATEVGKSEWWCRKKRKEANRQRGTSA
jgi:hypothetical protein